MEVTDQSTRTMPSKSISVRAVTVRPEGDSKRRSKTTCPGPEETGAIRPRVQRTSLPFTVAAGLSGAASSRRPAEMTCEAKAVLAKVWVRPQQLTSRPFGEADTSSGVHGARTFRVIPSREPSHGKSPGHLSSSVRVAKRNPSRLMKVARKSQQPEGIPLVSKLTSSRPIRLMTRRSRSSLER